jgi:rhamnulokinase
MQKLFAAVDLGASSGRVIAGLIDQGSIEIVEIHRFANNPLESGSSLYWDFESLKSEITAGLKKLGDFADEKNMVVTSIGVDTWAVDYGLIDRAGKLIDGVRNYRDERNALGVALIEQVVSPIELYEINGLQFLPFNTIYQLAAEQLQTPNHLETARTLLLVPDLINYWLTGIALTERTNASTTGLLDVHTKAWNFDLIKRIGLKREIFSELSDPGDVVGELLPRFKTHPAFENTIVRAVPSHDTAAAVAGTPLEDAKSAYLSSGTWSLLGLELDEPNNSPAARNANFTNELGAENRVRFLKNLSGLWLLQQSMVEFTRTIPEIELVTLLSEASTVESSARIDVTDDEFATHGDMPAKIQTACARRGGPIPTTPAAIVRCIVDSLADAYADGVVALEKASGITIKSIQIVGGGSQNDLLSQLTADRTHKRVSAGPVEATALGNLLTQAGAEGLIQGGLKSQRALIRSSFTPKIFTPRNVGAKQ